METLLYTTNYDSQLQATLKHLVGYPQLLPFIGNAWELRENKVLFVAESHYLPEASNDKSNSQTWYDNEDSCLTPCEKAWTYTRGVVNGADNYALDKNNFSKGHTIFYNLKTAIFEAFQIKNKSQHLFQHFGFYNYFQRPAEKTGHSIKNIEIDDRIAYETLKAITTIAKPSVIIFVSKKAFESFEKSDVKAEVKISSLVTIHRLPHPASQWWYRKSGKYGSKSAPISGKTKLTQIIETLDLKIESDR